MVLFDVNPKKHTIIRKNNTQAHSVTHTKSYENKPPGKIVMNSH